MKRVLLFLILVTGMCSAVSAQQPADSTAKTTQKNVYLWPDGNYPVTNGRENEPARNKWFPKPFIRIYQADPAKATGRAVVCLPGGGYSHLASSHEGYDWAPYFNEMGVTLVVLHYRMPYGNYKVPTGDAYEGIRYVREHAAELNIDPNNVGIMGFSAGGHLASTVATHAEPALRPNFQILFYPVVTMDTLVTHRGSHDNLIGRYPSADTIAMFSNELQVDSLTPPAILLLADDDRAVPSPNSVNYYLALKQQGIPAAMHIYPSGGHGFGARKSYRYHESLVRSLTEWLEQLKPKPVSETGK